MSRTTYAEPARPDVIARPAPKADGPANGSDAEKSRPAGTAGTAGTASIVAAGVNVYYGQTHAIKDVSVTMPPNRVTALIGPSGCGKSTFLRSINRMNDLIPGCRVTGEISIAGHNVYAPGVDLVSLRRRVGLVFQKPNPFPKSIYDNVAYGPRLQGIRRRGDLDPLVEESLRKAAIWNEVKDRLKTSALGMSGGQQQRLCIARALATKPSVLLMDEPASALDPIATGKIEDLIQELKELVTVAIVTHNMQQASRVSDVTAFFYLGELIEVDQTKKMFTNPSKKQTEDYITGRFG